MPSKAKLENFSIRTIEKQHIKEIICRVKRGKKIMEKLNRAQKCSILGPQKPRVKGGPGPRAPGTPLDPRLHEVIDFRVTSQLSDQIGHTH